MKKTLLLYIFLLSFFAANTQISYSPSALGVSGTSDQAEVISEFHLSQSTNPSVTLYWKLEKTDNFKTDWASSVCDQITCYGPNADVSDPSLGNVLMKDQSYLWSFHLRLNGVAGSDTVFLKLYDDAMHSNLVTTIPISIGIGFPSGTTSVPATDLQLFPNPTTEYFEILEDANVSEVAIYNIVGKKMKQENHIIGQSHYVNGLQRGMYLVRLLDKDGSILKVVRMTKK